MSDTFITKYRPTKFEDVIGHEAQVKALQAALKKGTSRSFLFTGDAGLGKTTLARMVATYAGCKPGDLTEVDAATNTGIDDMREVTSLLDYRPIGEGKVKAIIIDEAHALSAQAWKSLLKSIEEPPEWVYWLLCTTDEVKVPKMIKTRCVHIALKPVPTKLIVQLLDDVAESEKLDVDEDVVELCAEEAGGSPRQALANLAVCADAKDENEAAKLLSSAVKSTAAIDLARALMAGKSWKEVQECLRLMKDQEPEGVRRVVLAYFNNVALSVDERKSGRCLEIIDAFSQPFYVPAHLTLACGKVLLG